MTSPPLANLGAEDKNGLPAPHDIVQSSKRPSNTMSAGSSGASKLAPIPGDQEAEIATRKEMRRQIKTILEQRKTAFVRISCQAGGSNIKKSPVKHRKTEHDEKDALDDSNQKVSSDEDLSRRTPKKTGNRHFYSPLGKGATPDKSHKFPNPSALPVPSWIRECSSPAGNRSSAGKSIKSPKSHTSPPLTEMPPQYSRGHGAAPFAFAATSRSQAPSLDSSGRTSETSSVTLTFEDLDRLQTEDQSALSRGERSDSDEAGLAADMSQQTSAGTSAGDETAERASSQQQHGEVDETSTDRHRRDVTPDADLMINDGEEAVECVCLSQRALGEDLSSLGHYRKVDPEVVPSTTGGREEESTERPVPSQPSPGGQKAPVSRKQSNSENAGVPSACADVSLEEEEMVGCSAWETLPQGHGV